MCVPFPGGQAEADALWYPWTGRTEQGKYVSHQMCVKPLLDAGTVLGAAWLDSTKPSFYSWGACILV